jgi:lipoprotein-anchoring transpeptidase ErfK/SrfK
MARRIALVLVLVLAASLGGSLRAPSAPAAAPPVVRVAKKPLTRPAVTRPHRRKSRGTLVARVRPGREALLRSAANGPVVARLGSTTAFGSPQTFAVTRLLRGRRYRVISTALPNGRAGWVDAAPGTFTLSHARVTLEIDLSAETLRMRRAARVLRTMRVGIGAPGTPTPTGRFAVTDKLDGARYSPVYGCCILALSAHQTHLPSGWTGGDRIAIHGGPTGGAVSTGCLHAGTVDLRYLMRTVPLGAQVVIHP